MNIAAGGIFAGLVFLLLWLEHRAAAPAVEGTEYFPPPPADSFTNPEVGDVISGGSGLPVTPDKIDTLARAIAMAEGFFSSDPNVVPRRAHNPGDLTRDFVQPTLGVANAEGVLIFASDDAGWSALKAQVTAMLTGGSHVYSPNMTLAQVAQKYTGGDGSGSWARNAGAVLGISPDETLEDFLNA